MALPRVLEPPVLDGADLAAIDLIERVRSEIESGSQLPVRWTGGLRRMALVRAVQGSNSIEGYAASLDDVAAIVAGQPPFDAADETQSALRGYRDAMSFILQIAADGGAVDATLLKALHFMILAHEPFKRPGRWRPGEVFVHRDSDGARVYVGPDAELVPDLVEAMISQISDSGAPVLVAAAMAHLNLVMIHPFRDGNGRMARAIQTLVLARDHVVSPVFSSIEEYLGSNTPAYYDVLASVGGGSWNPDADTRPWVRFVLTAHYRQALTHLRRRTETEQLWNECARLAKTAGVPERSVAGLVEAANRFRVRNGGYRKAVEYSVGEAISELTASRDLKALCDAGLLLPVGERRGRHYIAGQQLSAAGEAIRAARPMDADYDPYRPPDVS